VHSTALSNQPSPVDKHVLGHCVLPKVELLLEGGRKFKVPNCSNVELKLGH
jgi:hypothetical protein